MNSGDMRKPTRGTDNRVVEVCRLLNSHKVIYLLVGGVAANLHGTLRSTKDVDVLVPKDLANMERLLQALSKLPYGIAKELDANELLAKPITIIGDDPRVDVLTAAGRINYERAKKGKKTRKVLGVTLPFVSLKDLILSKRTGRPQDEADIQVLIGSNPSIIKS